MSKRINQEKCIDESPVGQYGPLTVWQMIGWSRIYVAVQSKVRGEVDHESDG